MESGMSLVEWPWLIQPRLNWLPMILSDPISILLKIKDLHFSLSPGSGYCHSLCELQYNLEEFRLIHHESLINPAFVSLRVKMKRLNIDVCIPCYKHSIVFDLPHAHIFRQHCEIQQKPDWTIIFTQNTGAVTVNEIRIFRKGNLIND